MVFMKKPLYICAIFGLFFIPAWAQQADSSAKKWEVEASILWYIIPDDPFILPILSADKGKLHLESRFNYEDRNTLSFFAGYNINGGRKLSYTFTPMLGLVLGNTDGLAPGLETTLGIGKFELYSEMEYLFDFADNTGNYYYNWTELRFYPKDWFWFGITGQRTKAYQTALDIQSGLLAGLSWKKLSITGYLFNPWTNGTFGILSASWEF